MERLIEKLRKAVTLGDAPIMSGFGVLVEKTTLQEAIDRLAYYKDMEEQGRLVVLPCKVGDTVYITEPRFYNYELHEGVQKGICEGYTMHDEYGWVVKVKLEKGEPHTLYYYNFSKFGKTVFLTREEAEQALKGGADSGDRSN